MSWRPQYRSSKFRHVFGKPANKECCLDGVPITQSVQDNFFCAVNPKFIAIVTECAGGGAFLVIPVQQTGKIDPQHPRICGHKKNVLDIKWNPFDDYIIASASEDTTVKIWEIPNTGVTKSINNAKMELVGHSRRVGLLEWHPTATNIIFSAGYDYKILVWNLESQESVYKSPVRSFDIHNDVILSMSFNRDGSLLATACKDRKIRVLDPRSGKVQQETDCKTHKTSKVLFLGNMRRLLSTGTSRWNSRQVALWDQDDLSEPLHHEDLDGGSGIVFPFYDHDTHMLYIAPKGEGVIRYYEVSTEKPFLHFLAEYRSCLPQKGMGVMPKRGLDVSICEVLRFYRLVTTKNLVEPVSMIVPRRSEAYQDDIYPMTASSKPAMTAHEWLSGLNKDPLLMSLKPGCDIFLPPPQSTDKEILCTINPQKYPDRVERVTVGQIPVTGELKEHRGQSRVDDKVLERRHSMLSYRDYRRTEPRVVDRRYSLLANGCDLSQCAPPKTENELLQMFYKQQEEIRKLRDMVAQREIRIKQLELEVKNLHNSPNY